MTNNTLTWQRNVHYRYVTLFLDPTLFIEFFSVTEKDSEKEGEKMFVVDFFGNGKHRVTLTYPTDKIVSDDVFVRFWLAMNLPDADKRIPPEALQLHTWFNSLRRYTLPVVKFTLDNSNNMISIFRNLLRAHPYLALHCDAEASQIVYHENNQVLHVTLKESAYTYREPLLRALYSAAHFPKWEVIFTKSFGNGHEMLRTDFDDVTDINLLFS